jgi:hypothetical protein
VNPCFLANSREGWVSRASAGTPVSVRIDQSRPDAAPPKHRLDEVGGVDLVAVVGEREDGDAGPDHGVPLERGEGLPALVAHRHRQEAHHLRVGPVQGPRALVQVGGLDDLVVATQQGVVVGVEAAHVHA